MGQPRMIKYEYNIAVILALINDKIIMGVPCGKGLLVARWGVNKTTLLREAKRRTR